MDDMSRANAKAKAEGYGNKIRIKKMENLL